MAQERVGERFFGQAGRYEACFPDGKRGASLTGYGLIVGLIAIVAIAAVSNVGDEVAALFGSVGTQMESASSGGGSGGGGDDEPEADSDGPPDFLGGELELDTGLVLEDVTEDVLALFSDDDLPLVLTLAANADGSCITVVQFDDGAVSVSTAASACNGSFQVIVQDAEGESTGFTAIPVVVTAPPSGIGFCPNNPPEAGDEGCDPGDGTIFVGLIDTNGPDVSGGENTPIFMMSEDWGGAQWKNANTNSGTQGCGDSLSTHFRCFDGKQNTEDLVALGDHAAVAACDNLELLGYGPGDWYLPSIRELDLMYDNLRLNDVDEDEDDVTDIYGFRILESDAFEQYWASTERANNAGWYKRFSNGGGGGQFKNLSRSIRCVRR